MLRALARNTVKPVIVRRLFCTMAETMEVLKPEKYTGKREFIADDKEADSAETKKPRMQTNEERKKDNLPYKKKKMALMMAYCGKGYQGMQINPGCNTIEKVLIDALVKSGCINKNHAYKLSNMSFQRAARTDKGVSAAGQVISLKMFSDVVNPIVKINAQLPPHIRVFSLKRTTKGFDSKNACTGRSYQYLMPTYAFTKFNSNMTMDYRMSEETLQKIKDTLAMFKGTHNFHNFTSGKLPNDKSANRYITEFTIGKPFIQNDVEFAHITIQGQSFMMHQIRKMIGLTIAIVQDLTDTTSIDKAWEAAKCDIPKAPGLGLLLEACHYHFYNKKFGGTHDKLDWEDIRKEVDEFKEKYIYSTIIDTEIQEKSMMQWLGTLHLHTFDEKKQEVSSEMMKLHKLCRKDQLPKDGADDSNSSPENGASNDDEKEEVEDMPEESGSPTKESGSPSEESGSPAEESGSPAEESDSPTKSEKDIEGGS